MPPFHESAPVSVPTSFTGIVLPAQHSLVIMLWLQYSRYLIACSLLASEVLSLPELEGSASPDVGLSLELDLNTLSSNQGNFIASRSDLNTPSDYSFNEITNNIYPADQPQTPPRVPKLRLCPIWREWRLDKHNPILTLLTPTKYSIPRGQWSRPQSPLGYSNRLDEAQSTWLQRWKICFLLPTRPS